jgi:hypothetical protein
MKKIKKNKKMKNWFLSMMIINIKKINNLLINLIKYLIE